VHAKVEKSEFFLCHKKFSIKHAFSTYLLEGEGTNGTPHFTISKVLMIIEQDFIIYQKLPIYALRYTLTAWAVKLDGPLFYRT